MEQMKELTEFSSDPIRWLLGKLLGTKYRLNYVKKTGRYIWSFKNAAKDNGLRFMTQVALLRVNERLAKSAQRKPDDE